MRKLYPNITYGAIASSGKYSRKVSPHRTILTHHYSEAVTHAAVDYSDYFEVIRRTANQTCIAHIVSAVQTIDKLLDNPLLATPLKALFGLAGLQHDDDFASLLTEPLGGVQGMNWDQAVSSTSWDKFCEKINSGGAGVQLGLVRVPAEVVNYAAWVREEIVSQCPKENTAEDVSSNFEYHCGVSC